jgi:hypothetical protein
MKSYRQSSPSRRLHSVVWVHSKRLADVAERIVNDDIAVGAEVEDIDRVVGSFVTASIASTVLDVSAFRCRPLPRMSIRLGSASSFLKKSKTWPCVCPLAEDEPTESYTPRTRTQRIRA